jgi:hypothetical protein
MEITCIRCNQAVEADSCYCATCGLPQLQYSAENVPGQAPPERWNEPIRDASMVDWKRALPTVLLFAIPAGFLCPMLYPMGFVGLFLMAMAAYWVVILYVRSQRPAWITVGAGARIGLVTGLLSSWLGAALIGGSLFAIRVFLHQGKSIDDAWNDRVVSPMTQQWISMGSDAPTLAMLRGWVTSPEGRAGWIFSSVVFLVVLLVLFAVGGGALGARSHSGARRPQA